MSKRKPPKTTLNLLLASALILPLASPLIVPQPAQANPFKGLFSGILKQGKGIGLGIIKTAVTNPVGTFRLLNGRVFKIKGTEKYLKHYDKYGQYLKYVPGIGGQPIPPGLVIDIAAQEAGLENGIPRDLNAVLDTILGPQKNKDGSPAGSSGCFSSATSCGPDGYTTLLEQIQKEAVIASTGPLGIPDPSIIRAAITESSKRGLQPDLMMSNKVVANGFAANEADRKVVKAKSGAALSVQGQQNSLDTMTAVDEGLKGVVETAQGGLESRVTQEVVKSLLSVTSQNAGFMAINTINGEQEKIDRALILNQLANSSQAQDSIRRQRDAELNANTARLIYLSRKHNRY